MGTELCYLNSLHSGGASERALKRLKRSETALKGEYVVAYKTGRYSDGKTDKLLIIEFRKHTVLLKYHVR